MRTDKKHKTPNDQFHTIHKRHNIVTHANQLSSNVHIFLLAVACSRMLMCFNLLGFVFVFLLIVCLWISIRQSIYKTTYQLISLQCNSCLFPSWLVLLCCMPISPI